MQAASLPRSSGSRGSSEPRRDPGEPDGIGKCSPARELRGEIVSNFLPGNDVAAIHLGDGVKDPLFLIGGKIAEPRRVLRQNILSRWKITELLREILAVPVKHPNHHG